MDVNSPERAKIDRSDNDGYESASQASPIVYRRIKPKPVRRIASPSPDPARPPGDTPSGSTSATRVVSSSVPASSGLVEADYWSTEPISETLSKGELLRMLRVLDRARVALHDKLPNLDDVQREATEVIGHNELVKLFSMGFVSRKAFDSLRLTSYLTPEALADAHIVEVKGDPTELGIYEDTGKVGEPFRGQHAGYTGSGSGTQLRRSVGGVRLAGVRARVLGEHENEDYRQKNPCPHYALGYDDSGEPHLYLWWWRMAAARYEAWLRTFFPDATKERFQVLRVAVTNILEALFIQMLGRYKMKIIDKIKVEEGVPVISTPYQGLNRATALAKSGEFITPETSFPMREKGRYAMAKKRGFKYETGDKWNQNQYNIENSGGSYPGLPQAKYLVFKGAAIRAWIAGTRQVSVSIRVPLNLLVKDKQPVVERLDSSHQLQVHPTTGCCCFPSPSRAWPGTPDKQVHPVLALWRASISRGGKGIQLANPGARAGFLA